MIRFAFALAVLSLASAAEVRKVYVDARTDVLDGKAFGKSGPYERISAKAHFAVDPKLPQNSTIRDLHLAPRNAAGLVEFSADIYVLKPRDPAKGNGTALLEVSNRGGRGMLRRFNLPAASGGAAEDASFGDAFLLEEGYTLVWVGWQWDVPAQDGLLRLDAPIASENGKPIRGVVRSEFVPESAVSLMPLSDRNHVPYPALAGVPASLTVRESVTARRSQIPASDWKFNAARTAVEKPSGFNPGLLYELVYTAENPRVAGLGMAAIRDFVAYLKYGGDGLSVLGDQRRFIKRAIGFGVSQSGRWLRTFLYFGQNEDERGRKVFDAVWADVAGAGRGSFNHRFAQASRDGSAHFNTLYATDLFPFSDVPQSDPFTGDSLGLLSRVRDAVMPHIFYTNTAGEYWNRCASLIHTSPDGRLDAPLPPQTRLYVVSAAQHGPASGSTNRKDSRYPTNPNEFRPLQRALLTALHEWVRDNRNPPPSVYPLIAEKQLVPLAGMRFPKIPGVEVPKYPRLAYPLDFGPGFEESGVVAKEPPRVGRPYALLVPQVDEDGIDLGGIRMPAFQVPLGTATGWNLRAASTGAPSQIVPLIGSWFPFPANERTRTGSRDPRRSIEERYASRQEYLTRVGEASTGMVTRRFLLPRDVPFVAENAARLWDATASR